MSVLRLIDTLNADSKVGRVIIEFRSSNEWNDQIIMMIINKYSNVYHIGITHYNDSIDN